MSYSPTRALWFPIQHDWGFTLLSIPIIILGIWWIKKQGIW